MYLALLQDARLYAFLLQVDRDLAETTRRSACRFCGGRLHSACYARKPRGVPDGIDPGPAFPIRFSFCCRVDGCRRRHLPPSVRFLGPKVYLSVMVVLLTAMRQGPTPRSLRELRDIFGADRRTLARWRHWWQAVFSASGFWQRFKARFMPPVTEHELPGSLVGRFSADTLLERIVRVLKFLSGLTTAC
ncbi:MAG: hypothetical protein ACYSVY_13565 [Planctomycetota bacterium]|jgi:hypothetical protein